MTSISTLFVVVLTLVLLLLFLNLNLVQLYWKTLQLSKRDSNVRIALPGHRYAQIKADPNPAEDKKLFESDPATCKYMQPGHPFARQTEPLRAGFDIALQIVGLQPRLFVLNGDMALKILKLPMEEVELDPFRKTRFSIMFKKALIASNGDAWRRLKPLFTSISKPQLLDDYAKIFSRLARKQLSGHSVPQSSNSEHVSVLACPSDNASCPESKPQMTTTTPREGTAPTGQQVDLVAMFKVLAARAIGACAFGDEFEDAERAVHVARVNTKMFAETANYMNSVEAQIPLVNALPTPKRQVALRAATQCKRIAGDLLAARQNHSTATMISEPDFIGAATEMIKGLKFGVDEIIDNSAMLIVAGHETTAYTMAWLMAAFATHPEVFKRCVKEVRDVMGTSRDFCTGHVDHMPYMKACIIETLRLFPPIAFIERRVKVPMAFSESVVFPPGTSFTVDVFSVHHNELLWEHPFKFDPTRHLRADGQTFERPGSDKFLAFSAGPRLCPGMLFAQREIISVISTLLRNSDILFPTSPSDLSMRVGITISPQNPIMCEIRPIPLTDDEQLADASVSPSSSAV